MENEMALAERLQRMESIHEIRNLMAAYCQSVDMRDKARFLTIWEEDAVYEVPKGASVGIQAIEAMYDTIVTDALKHHHHVSNVFLEVEGDRAKAVSDLFFYRLDANGNSFLLSGRYRDEFSKRSGKWLFQRRAFEAHINKSPIF